MPFDREPERNDTCPLCGGFGLRTVHRKIDGKDALATVPCDCKAGQAYKQDRL